MEHNGGRRRPTIKDVAAVAGVSRGTVSRVLNGGRWVSPDALTAVQAAIKSTGYAANRHARSLVTGRANSVAFLLTEPHQLLFEDPNFSVLLRGAADALAKRDIPLLLMTAGTPAERRRVTDYVTAGHVDGVLVISSHAHDPMVASLLREKIPVVACGVPLGYEGKVGYVAADDVEGARRMVRHLRDSGRQQIATITGPLDTPGGVLRLQGYRDELGAGYDKELVAHGDYSRLGGQRAMAALLAARPGIDAVFVASDLMAAGALTTLAAHGRRVPEDVAVGGFDDSWLAATLTPALTTMRQPFERITTEMVRLLEEIVGGERPAAVILPTTLVHREST
ncbi:LacI family DNA-binding transcriptional regulator [Kribbella sp. NPDC006257]|uniref:LacI family DNA-binding transcriptional regulator n=1 Tax=Kribbella sp. NPDC006257 TaxID=3156738 RepID=UPI0033B9160E